MNSAVKVQPGHAGPPEVSRPGKPSQPPDDVTVNTGTPHRGGNLLSALHMDPSHAVIRVGVDEHGRVTLQLHTRHRHRAHVNSRRSRVAAAVRSPGAMGDSLACTRFFLLFFHQPRPPLLLLAGVFFSLPTLHERRLHGSSCGCVRGFDACKCALADAESAF